MERDCFTLRQRQINYITTCNINSYKNGADEIRTHDFLHAMQALSQLSYGPLDITVKNIAHHYIPVSETVNTFSGTFIIFL